MFTPVAPLTANGQISGPYQRPQIEQFGNIPYNGFWGPGLFTTDLALSKVFNLYESLSMKLEVQAQNAFNHVNLANPSNTCVDCAGNGQINRYPRRYLCGYATAPICSEVLVLGASDGRSSPRARFNWCSQQDYFQTKSRRDGWKQAADAILDNFSRPCGTQSCCMMYPGLTSWAKFSRPYGTS